MIVINFEKLLYKEGLWSLYGTNEKDSIAMCHLCRDNKSELTNHVVSQGNCTYCGQVPPDEISGVFKMHNWGDLAASHTAWDFEKLGDQLLEKHVHSIIEQMKSGPPIYSQLRADTQFKTSGKGAYFKWKK